VGSVRLFRIEVEAFLQTRSDDMENRKLRLSREGHVDAFPCSEVLRHVIAHEIHHIGQLSVWARELGRKPVSAHLIGRGLLSGNER
jgi:uncharacterized damage-inducible protein DinB